MYTPTTTGGHALYTLDLLSALAAANPCPDLEVSLFTCSDLPSRYRAGSYPIHDPLPPMRPIRDFRNAALWSFYRQWYSTNRERRFVRLITNSQRCRAVHFQEYTPWLMHRHFSRLKHAGFASSIQSTAFTPTGIWTVFQKPFFTNGAATDGSYATLCSFTRRVWAGFSIVSWEKITPLFLSPLTVQTIA